MKMQKERELFSKAWDSAFDGFVPRAISRFESRRIGFTPLQMVEFDGRCRQAVWEPSNRSAWRKAAMARVQAGHEVALLALHAADGFLREAAVRHAPMNDAAALTMLLLRCNDWVRQVRLAARTRLGALVPGLERETLALMVLVVLDCAPKWQRGGAVAAKAFTDHPEWPAAVKLALMQTIDGPVARVLRQLLVTPECDWMLPDLAMTAKSGAVGALAVRALLESHVRWVSGYRYEVSWGFSAKKPFGTGSHRRPLFECREFRVPYATQQTVLRSACFDRDAGVRRAAADALILHGPPEDLGLLDRLAQDVKPSVRDRMAFYERKWATKWTTQTPKIERAEK